ncbi:Zinc finger protein 629-like 2 [Homarus americanus]|uniref:Zinc finger protein 629-like 2 n=2 Tax=Homarus americanus TaxID=6706 RepID=A0A8J5KDG0_HOMAM|nr:Zinc finger protein 629-like 2 [Homarus americanus]
MSIEGHMGVHTGETPFHCPDCHNKFSWKSDLVNHVKEHTGQNSLKCSRCYKEYKCKCHLKEQIDREQVSEKPSDETGTEHEVYILGASWLHGDNPPIYNHHCLWPIHALCSSCYRKDECVQPSQLEVELSYQNMDNVCVMVDSAADVIDCSGGVQENDCPQDCNSSCDSMDPLGCELIAESAVKVENLDENCIYIKEEL